MTLTSEEIKLIADGLWANLKLNLAIQQVSTSVLYPGEPLTIYRDITVVLDFVTSPIEVGTDVWFTIKDDLDSLDSAAALQVQSTAGLNYLDGYEKTGVDKELATLVYLDTSVTVTIKPGASAYLPIYQAKTVSWDLKSSKDGVAILLQSGKTYILPTATRTI